MAKVKGWMATLAITNDSISAQEEFEHSLAVEVIKLLTGANCFPALFLCGVVVAVKSASCFSPAANKYNKKKKKFYT